MTAKKRVVSWVVTDDFWIRVEPLIPIRERPEGKEYARKAGAGRKPKAARLVFEAIWAAGLAEYDNMEGIAWRWQSMDGAMFNRENPLA